MCDSKSCSKNNQAGWHLTLSLSAALLLTLLPGLSSALTLSESVKHTLKTHPDIAAARFQVNAREQEIRQARAGYRPKVDLAAGIGHEDTRTSLTGGREVSLTRRESSLRLRQMLFDGFATREEVKRQQARTGSSRFATQATVEDIALRTTEVYLNFLRQSDLLTLARTTLSEHQNIHDQMVLRARAGVGSRADLDQISARLAQTQSNMIAVQNNLLDAKTNFYRVTGLLPELSVLSKPAVNAAFPATLAEAQAIALQQHPTLLSAGEDVAAARAQYEASKHRFWPRFQLEADKRLDSDIDGQEGDSEDLVVALRMTYNLYNGNADSSRRKQAAYLVEEAKSIRNNTSRQVVESLRLSWSALEAIRDQIAYLDLNVSAARSTKEAYLKQFNIGRRTLLDLLNTENEVVDAQRSLINAGYDKLFSHYRVFNSMGQLLASIDQSGDAEASVQGAAPSQLAAAPQPLEPIFGTSVEEAESSTSRPQPVASQSLVYAIQLAAFNQVEHRDKFVRQNGDRQLQCRRKDNGYYAVYYSVYNDFESAKRGLVEDSRVAKYGGYIVKLRDVSFHPCADS